MTTARLDFAALRQGDRIEPVMLVAGCPVVFTCGGTRPTAFAVSSGTFDSLWWPGIYATITLPGAVSWYTVRDLLDPHVVWTTRQTLKLVDGDVSVDPLVVDVADVQGQATAIFSRSRASTSQLLSSEASDTAAAWQLADDAGFATDGVAHCGREAVYYSGITANALTITGHAKFGSKAAVHKVPAGHPPVVTYGALPRYLHGRRAAVFLCRVSADGTTLSDPTLWHLGVVGAGVSLVRGGTRWQVTLDHITEVLRRAPDVTVSLYGWQHGHGHQSPITAQGGASYLLEIGPETGDGWSANFRAFAENWRAAARAASQPFEVFRDTNGDCRVQATTTGSFTFSSFLEPMSASVEGPGGFSFQGAPDTCMVLDRVIHLDDADFALIPAVLDYTVSSPAAGVARYALIADTDDTEAVAATITERDGTAKTITVRGDTEAQGTERVRALRITKRTQAKVGIVSTGDTALGALKALALAIDAIGGADDESGAIDWDHLAATFAGVPSVGAPDARAYRVGGGDDTLLSLLVDEARLRGCTLTVRRGRVTAIRAASFASSEALGAVEILERDCLVEQGDAGRIPYELVDQPEAPAATVDFELRGGLTYRYQDDTFASEFGAAKVVTCGALKWVPATVAAPGDLARSLAIPALQILGVLAEPQRIVRVTLGPRFLGLEPGDLVVFTHSEIPNHDGTRGVTEAVCQIEEVERSVFGGQARTTVALRLGETSLGGYAPSALVAAAGLTAGSPVVTLDTASAFGASCFAPVGQDPSYGFAAGDVVVLSQYDAETVTVTEIQRTVVAVGATTLTLDSAPSAGMVTQAAGQYGVVVRTAAWTASTADQKARSLYIADDATGAFSDAAAAKRWAA